MSALREIEPPLPAANDPRPARVVGHAERDDTTIADRVITYALAPERGDGEAQRFVHGEPRAPFGIGSEGAMKVRGDGVLALHAFAHFDGHALLVCSTDDGSPARVDGAPLPRRWTEVTPPCTLTFGSATVRFTCAISGSSDAAAEPAPAPTCPPAAFEAPDVTRVPPPGAPNRARRRVRPWHASATGALVLIVGVGAYTRHVAKAPPPAPRPTAPVAAPEHAPPATASPTASPEGVIVHPQPARVADLPPAPLPKAPAPRTPPRAPPTPEREALDALHVGDVARAAHLYEALAHEHPDDPSFATVARVLRTRTSMP